MIAAALGGEQPRRAPPRSPTSPRPTSRSTSGRRSASASPGSSSPRSARSNPTTAATPPPTCPNAAGAEGPMQFEPPTFAAYTWAAGRPDPNIDDPHDAIFAAAAMLAGERRPRRDRRGALRLQPRRLVRQRGPRLGGDLHERGRGRRRRRARRRRAPPPPRAVAYALASSGRPTSGAARARRLRLLRARPGRLRRGRDPPPAHRAGPVRRRAAAPRRRSRSSPATSSSSARHRATSTTSGSSSARARWSTRPHRRRRPHEPFDWPDYLGATRPAADAPEPATGRGGDDA